MLDEILARIADKPPQCDVTPATLGFLHRHGVPPGTIDLLVRCSYAGPVRVGRLWFNAVDGIPAENRQKSNRPCVHNGFLIIGSGLNGDPIAIELTTGKVAFISHARLWEKDFVEFDECVARSPFDLNEFWTRAHADPDFPVDYHAAGGGA